MHPLIVEKGPAEYTVTSPLGALVSVEIYKDVSLNALDDVTPNEVLLLFLTYKTFCFLSLIYYLLNESMLHFIRKFEQFVFPIQKIIYLKLVIFKGVDKIFKLYFILCILFIIILILGNFIYQPYHYY